MTKTVTRYQCEICKELYLTNHEAEQCESRGRETPLAAKGDLIDFRVEMGGGFADWFAPVRVRAIVVNGHYLVYYFEEEYEVGEWEESMHFNSVLGSDEFKKLCTVKSN